MTSAPIVYMIATVAFVVLAGEMLSLPLWTIFVLALAGNLALELLDPLGIADTRGSHV